MYDCSRCNFIIIVERAFYHNHPQAIQFFFKDKTMYTKKKKKPKWKMKHWRKQKWDFEGSWFDLIGKKKLKDSGFVDLIITFPCKRKLRREFQGIETQKKIS